MKRETKFLLAGVGLGTLLGFLLGVATIVAINLYARARYERQIAQSSAQEQGREAVDFALRDVNPASPTHGQTVKLSEQWKGRGVVVNFMASWCGPCRMELPALQAIHEAGVAKILCIASDEGAAGTGDLLAMVSAAGLTIPVLYAEDGDAEQINAAYDNEALPSTYLIGPDGKIRDLLTGARPEEAFRRAIARHLPPW